jgi:hypothetical protein
VPKKESEPTNEQSRAGELAPENRYTAAQKHHFGVPDSV